jgi:hypothetical protein
MTLLTQPSRWKKAFASRTIREVPVTEQRVCRFGGAFDKNKVRWHRVKNALTRLSTIGSFVRVFFLTEQMEKNERKNWFGQRESRAKG